jgi:uroporphyrin-III C-methyltransferase
VVRLKGGDPFVFGRGAEELAALRAAGIDAQVVPGVSSATGVPTSAGIALTERGISHAFTVVTGHTAPWASVVNWRAVAAIGGTIVVLMGGGAMDELSEELQASGLSRDTPVAVICDGTRPHQQVLRTTLEGLANVSGLPSSPTIVIGAVAAEALPPRSDHYPVLSRNECPQIPSPTNVRVMAERRLGDVRERRSQLAVVPADREE